MSGPPVTIPVVHQSSRWWKSMTFIKLAFHKAWKLLSWHPSGAIGISSVAAPAPHRSHGTAMAVLGIPYASSADGALQRARSWPLASLLNLTTRCMLRACCATGAAAEPLIERHA